MGEPMATKTLKELRAAAKALGIKGYSTMSRRALELRLAGAGEPKVPAPKTAKQSAAKKKPAQVNTKTARSAAKSARAGGIVKPSSPLAPVPEKPLATHYLSGEEERVENAKYATVLPGSATPSIVTIDLGEDIDNMPPVSEPMLCLLPQKPGVLHGYWIVPSNSVPDLSALKLRLGRIVGDTQEIIQEFALSHERGHWYFHLDESENIGAVYLQLGYYQPDGRFVTACRRGIARIPSLYSSQRTDRLWWVSDEQFRAMYLRAGGFVRGPRLGWAASVGSPGGVRGVSSERLAWPGNISSQR